MSLKKYLLIYKRIDELIKTRSTGTPHELAEKLDISDRQLFNYLKDLRDLDYSIEYSISEKSYVYHSYKEFV